MKVLHVVNKFRGGYGTILKHLRSIGEEVLERKTEGDVDYNKYDFVILHSYLKDFPFKEVKTKKIFFVHGMGGVSKRYILGKFEYNPIRWFKRSQIIRYFKQFDYYISVTQSMSKMFKKLYGIDSITIYGGINFELLPEINNNKREKVIAFIGKSDWFKGSDRFFKLMKLIPEFEGYFIGPYEGKVKDIPKNVKMLGFLENPYEVLSKAKFLVVLSYFEPFSIATLEALYYNVPTLCLKSTGGTWEILQMLGIPLGFNNLNEIANFIRNHENLYKEFHFDRKRFLEFFDIKRFNRDLKFYLNLLKNPH